MSQLHVQVRTVLQRMGQKNSLHIVDPATWSTRGLQLHIACGKGIVLSQEGTVAQRKDATRQPKDGLVHTAWPIAVGKLFQVQEALHTPRAAFTIHTSPCAVFEPLYSNFCMR